MSEECEALCQVIRVCPSYLWSNNGLESVMGSENKNLELVGIVGACIFGNPIITHFLCTPKLDMVEKYVF